MTDIEIVVSATKGRSPSDLTVAELGITLVFANRLANRIFAGEHSAQDLSAFNSEPDAVSLRIKEMRQGSVIINAAVELANDPFAQGVAASIAADICRLPFVGPFGASIAAWAGFLASRREKLSLWSCASASHRFGSSPITQKMAGPPRGYMTTRSKCRLTIHSSRNRFAVRLNSGVRRQ